LARIVLTEKAIQIEVNVMKIPGSKATTRLLWM